MRPLSSAVISQSQTLAAQNTTPVALLPQVRSFQTTAVTRDIDSAAKFIGAGAATVGCAGSGMLCPFILYSLFTLAKTKTVCSIAEFYMIKKQKTKTIKSPTLIWCSCRIERLLVHGLVINLHLWQTDEYLVTQFIGNYEGKCRGKVWGKVCFVLKKLVFHIPAGCVYS